MDVTMFQDFIDPKLLVLIPVLLALGVALKKAEWLDDKHIPVGLGVIGIFLAVIWVCATSTFSGWQSVLLGVFTAIVQGVLCAAAAVYMHQIKHQNSVSG